MLLGGAVKKLATVPSNRDVGNAWTAFVLAELFEEWPARVDLDWMRVQEQTGLSPRKDGDEMFDGLIEWLRNEGYIRFGQTSDTGQFYDVTLTEKGFTVLGKKLDALQPALGDQLKAAAKGAGSEAGKATLQGLVSTVFAVGTTMLMSG